MASSRRTVLPELLDELEPNDPRARRSRRDLRRVHRAMRSVSILRQALMNAGLPQPPRRVLELGAGDASLLLRLGQALHPAWLGIELTVLDRLDLVSAETRKAYETLGWEVRVVRQDALQWAIDENPQHFDLCITTLFLHHFSAEALPTVMRAIATNCNAFVACEPRRNRLARIGSALIGLLGANRVTRSDAVTSVAAGFADQELSALWQGVASGWACREYRALPFSHCFTAVRLETTNTRTCAP